jgi:hypothetical protein
MLLILLVANPSKRRANGDKNENKNENTVHRLLAFTIKSFTE